MIICRTTQMLYGPWLSWPYSDYIFISFLDTEIKQAFHIPPSFASCLVTWKQGSCLFPCGAQTSLFVIPGDRHRKIPPLTQREITLFVLCQSTQILQRYCAPAAWALPGSPQRERATLCSRLNVKKIGVTKRESPQLLLILSSKYLYFIEH